MPRHKTIGRTWFAFAVASVLPVVFVSYLCCHYERSEVLLALFLIEWLLVLAVWRLLCPWLGPRSVMMAAVPFLLATCVGSGVVWETLAVYATPWTGSDDIRYLYQAIEAAELLRGSHWNLVESWQALVEHNNPFWTLAGWPFLLGLVGSVASPAETPAAYHAIALSMNAAMFAMTPALIMRVVGRPARQCSWQLLGCILLLSIDPLVYAGQCLKESMLHLALMLGFVAGQNVFGRRTVIWAILGGLGILGVTLSRLPYVFLLLIVGARSIAVRIRLNKVVGTVIVLAVTMLLMSFYLGLKTGHIEAATQVAGSRLEGEPGLAMSVYDIPLVGPVLYYMISPVPPLPWKILNSTPIEVTRGAGSVLWFFATCYVLRGLARNRQRLKDGLFSSAAIMFVCLFAAAVVTGSDPRYKQPTNYYLAILLFLTWYDSRTIRGTILASRGPAHC